MHAPDVSSHRAYDRWRVASSPAESRFSRVPTRCSPIHHLIGVLSFFADFTYEGSRSVVGPQRFSVADSRDRWAINRAGGSGIDEARNCYILIKLKFIVLTVLGFDSGEPFQ
jgi:hypothetical protein